MKPALGCVRNRGVLERCRSRRDELCREGRSCRRIQRLVWDLQLGGLIRIAGSRRRAGNAVEGRSGRWCLGLGRLDAYDGLRDRLCRREAVHREGRDGDECHRAEGERDGSPAASPAWLDGSDLLGPFERLHVSPKAYSTSRAPYDASGCRATIRGGQTPAAFFSSLSASGTQSARTSMSGSSSRQPRKPKSM